MDRYFSRCGDKRMKLEEGEYLLQLLEGAGVPLVHFWFDGVGTRIDRCVMWYRNTLIQAVLRRVR